MDIVFVCSPFKNNPASLRMTKQYCRRLALEGDLPIAPHLYLPQFLNDDVEKERNVGMNYGRRLMSFCTRIDILEDEGISTGMEGDIEWAETLGLPQRRIKDL